MLPRKTSRDARAPAAFTAEALAGRLRTRIQLSELPPGEWLREARLCDEFGVGRSIVRRALRILAEDGLVALERNRGARVSATTVEEVFALYEVRAALYGLAARFACLRGTAAAIERMVELIDQLLADADNDAPAAQIIEISEAIFSEMAATASADAQRMIESIRRKTRWHFSYVALAMSAKGPGPYEHWRVIRAALLARDADRASQGARELLYFMQHEVARTFLARGPHLQRDGTVAEPTTRAGS